MCNRLEQYSICSYLFPVILALPKYVQPARFAFDPAADVAKTVVERATAWATVTSQAEDAAMALYDMQIAIASTSSFELDRFIATADAVDASVAASTAAAKVNGDLVSLSYLTPRDKPLGNFHYLTTLL